VDAPEDLRAAAAAGDVAAMTAYGKRLLAAREIEPVQQGVEYIRRAAALNDAEACAQLATLVASGIAGKSDWARAFDLMQRAAEHGWRDAQTDLRFLARGAGDDYAALRASIDIAGWLRSSDPILVREAPRILTCAGFMSGAECSRVIAKARPKLARAEVYNPESGGAQFDQGRSNTSAEFSILDADLPLILLSARISAVLGLRSVQFEAMNILHYNPGEEFIAHYDFLDDAKPGMAADKSQRGQRIVTFLVYLNDAFEGGETAFPRLNYAFKGGVGDAIMFGNVDARGAPELDSMHAGVAPTSGEKWLLSQWVRDRPQSRPKA
jgi:hypothetical protein